MSVLKMARAARTSSPTASSLRGRGRSVLSGVAAVVASSAAAPAGGGSPVPAGGPALEKGIEQRFEPEIQWRN